MSLDPTDSRPKSVQVAEALRREIRDGKHPTGKLPPTRVLAERFGIAGQTLANGMRILADEGVIFSSGNLGYFITKTPGNGTGTKSDVREEINELHSQIQALTQRVAALEEHSGSGGA